MNPLKALEAFKNLKNAGVAIDDIELFRKKIKDGQTTAATDFLTNKYPEIEETILSAKDTFENSW